MAFICRNSHLYLRGISIQLFNSHLFLDSKHISLPHMHLCRGYCQHRSSRDGRGLEKSSNRQCCTMVRKIITTFCFGHSPLYLCRSLRLTFISGQDSIAARRSSDEKDAMVPDMVKGISSRELLPSKAKRLRISAGATRKPCRFRS